MFNFIKKIFSKHEWKNSGWSYLRCKKCNARRYDPEKAGDLINEKISRMVEAGYWDRDEVAEKLFKGLK